MSESNKKTIKLKLPEGVGLQDGVELLEIEVGEATFRKTMIDNDGKTYEIESKIELPIIK